MSLDYVQHLVTPIIDLDEVVLSAMIAHTDDASLSTEGLLLLHTLLVKCLLTPHSVGENLYHFFACDSTHATLGRSVVPGGTKDKVSARKVNHKKKFQHVKAIKRNRFQRVKSIQKKQV